MYYHFQLRKFRYNGTYEESECEEWDFRALQKALVFIKREFGSESQAWRLEDLTDREADLLSLEPILAHALLSVHQYLILTFKDDSALLEKYDHYEFFTVVRDEDERPPAFSFSEMEEAEI